MHYLIGDLGHIFVITSFVTSLVAAYAYVRAHQETELEKAKAWLQNARASFYFHAIAVLGIVVCLFVIIYQHYFEYHYAYTHSSLHLPGDFDGF